MKETFIGGYWSERLESVEEVSKKTMNFILSLRRIDNMFSELRLPANSKKEAFKEIFEINFSNLKDTYLKGRKKDEVDEKGFCTIGFSLYLFNEYPAGISISINFSLGAKSKYFKNNCCIKVVGLELSQEVKNKIINSMELEFSPETFKCNVLN